MVCAAARAPAREPITLLNPLNVKLGPLPMLCQADGCDGRWRAWMWAGASSWTCSARSAAGGWVLPARAATGTSDSSLWVASQ